MKKALWAGAVLVAIAALAVFVWWQGRREAPFEMYVFDTPGSASVFIRTPSDKRVLINGGSNSEIVRRITEILPFYSRHIDLIIATDVEGKSVSGLVDVLNRYSVDRVIGMSSSSDPIYKTFKKAAKRLESVKAGDIIRFDDDVSAEVIFPLPEDQFKYSNASNPEILMRIRYGSNSFILAGQATTKVLKAIGVNATSSAGVIVHLREVNGIKIKKAGTAKIVSDGSYVRIVDI